MSPVDLEKKSQERVKQWLTTDLGYTFLGNLEDVDNTSVKEGLLKANLKKRGYKKQLIDKATQELLRCANNQSDSLYQVNWNVYQLLRYGANIKDENGLYITVHYIDWKNIDNNDFAVAEEVSVLCSNGCNHKRPDLVIYVNGIALAIFELKRSSIIAAEGIRQLIQNQKPENIERFFSTAQFLFAGNESQGLFYGTIETPELYYLQWKEDVKAHDDLSNTIKQIQDDRDNLLRNGVVSLCQKERFLSIIHDFIIFDAGIKKLARHNQYFANIAAHKFIHERQGGIIWNTQGSGKSLIMAWLTKWIRENISDSRVVIITDREELDDQIETLFYNVNEKIRRAKSCADLRTILNKNEDSIVCSLIHKYGHNSGKDSDIKKYLDELLRDLPANFSAKGNIFAFIDECHRTNSNKLHQAVRTLMPNAVLIGFTGTPLLNKDKKTSAEIFGPYIHTYKFNEGIKDRVILDLRYEARDVDQDLSSPDRVDSWFESKTRGLTQIAKDKLKQSWTTINRLYSSKQRLEKIAADIRFDMEIKPRLKNDRGTAMLVAGSIYEACKYWEIFKEQGFNKCAVVTSYIPNERNVRTEPTDLTLESEEEYKKRIYEQILGDKSPEDYEKEAKKLFKEQLQYPRYCTVSLTPYSPANFLASSKVSA